MQWEICYNGIHDLVTSRLHYHQYFHMEQNQMDFLFVTHSTVGGIICEGELLSKY